MTDDNWEWLRQAAAQHMAEYAKQFTSPGPDQTDPGVRQETPDPSGYLIKQPGEQSFEHGTGS